MSFSGTEESGEDDSGYSLVACLSNTRNITQLLKAIHFRENAMVFASATGLKVVVEEAKCIQASAYLQAEMFNSFNITEETLTFKINLTVLMECLNLFGSSPFGPMTNLKMCYGGYGTPLLLVLEEGGAITNCSIQTQEPDDDVLDFNFTNDSFVNKIIFKSECFKDVFTELDMSSDFVQITMSPDKPHFRLSTFGDACAFSMDCPKDSDLVELFQCSQTQKNSYKITMIKHAVKATVLSHKISIRMDDRGFLCLQFMILTEGGHVCFVEYCCSPDEEIDEDEEADH